MNMRAAKADVREHCAAPPCFLYRTYQVFYVCKGECVCCSLLR